MKNEEDKPERRHQQQSLNKNILYNTQNEH